MVEAKSSRLLANVARSVLSPLGCIRIGRSRVWIADQRFWAIVIEFQPSSFSKGSYLNVGASWLWYVRDHWSFDHGDRVERFESFRDEHQFAAVAERLSLRAAEEVRKLRSKLASLPAIAREITPKSDAVGWPVYHAAVAAGLIGNVTTAEHLFNRLIQERATAEWHKKLQVVGRDLAQILPDRHDFREAVLAIIQRSRAAHHLPSDPMCLPP